MKIGILGGSFDPPHYGHIRNALMAKAAANLDKVVLMAASNSPFKCQHFAPSTCRRLMTCMMTSKLEDENIYSDSRLTKDTSYAVDDVKYISNKHPEAELFLIVGDDCAGNFESWYRFEELLSMLKAVIVVPRIGADIPGWPITTIIADDPVCGISSTLVRKLVKEGKPLYGLIPSSVESYIREHKLYL
jgi:nicotinate-nucleotide adenylyltransferase